MNIVALVFIPSYMFSLVNKESQLTSQRFGSTTFDNQNYDSVNLF